MWVSVFPTQVLHPGPQVYTWQSALDSPGKGHFTSVPSLVSRSTLLLLSGPLSAATSFSGNSSTVTGPSDKLSYFWVSVNLHESPAMYEPVEAPNFLQRTGGMIYYSFIRHSTNWSWGCSCPWLFEVSEGFKGLCPLSFQTQLRGYCVFLDKSIAS